MKPDFALDFRDGQIALMHRVEGAWAVIGRVAQDDPDLDAAMSYLRATALGLSPRGIATKLIVPNDAVLYTALQGLPFDAVARAAQIAAGLQGRTPYDVADLVYDWTDAGDVAHLAVIARETLSEAEGFAAQHRFNPVSFAALPEQGGFDGEVWFGATQLSQTLLAPGEVVERDDVAAFAAGMAADTPPLATADFEMGEGVAVPRADWQTEGDLPAPEPASEALPETGAHDDWALGSADTALSAVGAAHEGMVLAELPPDPEPLAEILAESADEDGREVWQDFVAEDVPDDLPEVVDDKLAQAAPDLLPAPAPPENPQSDLFAGSFEAVFDAAPESDAQSDETAPISAPDTDVANRDVSKREPPDVEIPDFEAPMAIDVPLLDEADPPAPEFAEKKPSRAEALLSAFSARRAAAVAKAEAATNAAVKTTANTTANTAANTAMRAISPVDPPADDVVAVSANAGALAAEAKSADAQLASTADRSTEHSPAEPSAPRTPKLGAAEGAIGHAPPISMPDPAPAAVSAPVSNPQPAPMPAPVVSARPASVKHVPAKDLPQRKQNLAAMPGVKPRKSGMLGWILTAILLLSLLAAAAASELLFTAYNALFSDTTAIASAEDETGTVRAIPATNAEILADAGQTAAAPTIAAPSENAVSAVAASPAAPAAVALASRSAAPAPARPVLPSAAATANTASANAALPELAQPELAQPKLAPPVAQIQSANAPSAPSVLITVKSGRPAVVPQPRPDLVLAAAKVAAPADLPTAQATSTIFADPALAAARPAPRPASLAAAAAAAAPTEIAASPAPNADPALAGARPAPRPADIAAQGRAARLGSASASLVANAATNAAEAALLAAAPAIDPNLSTLALNISPVPPARPKGLRAAYEQKLADAKAAADAAAAQEATTRAASPTPSTDLAALEAEAEEEVTNSSGGAGSRSVVAKKATVKNAMDLSAVNLVGIFGSSANRYALIRQPSGMFKKLKVGDRFDGGRIAAITESEVRYDKGGELLALRMPRTYTRARNSARQTAVSTGKRRWKAFCCKHRSIWARR